MRYSVTRKSTEELVTALRGGDAMVYGDFLNLESV
jgi:hypothetical protein